MLFLEKSKSGISMKKGKIWHLGAGECHEGSLGMFAISLGMMMLSLLLPLTMYNTACMVAL